MNLTKVPKKRLRLYLNTPLSFISTVGLVRDTTCLSSNSSTEFTPELSWYCCSHESVLHSVSGHKSINHQSHTVGTIRATSVGTIRATQYHQSHTVGTIRATQLVPSEPHNWYHQPHNWYHQSHTVGTIRATQLVPSEPHSWYHQSHTVGTIRVPSATQLVPSEIRATQLVIRASLPSEPTVGTIRATQLVPSEISLSKLCQIFYHFLLYPDVACSKSFFFYNVNSAKILTFHGIYFLSVKVSSL